MISNNYTIILGGEFLGLFTVLHLQKQGYSRPVILIDKNKRFTLQISKNIFDFIS